MEQPICESISMIFSMLSGSRSGEVILFSTASNTPVGVWMPTAVEPSCAGEKRGAVSHGGSDRDGEGGGRTLIASMAYST
jgi:hypothetical protein